MQTCLLKTTNTFLLLSLQNCGHFKFNFRDEYALKLFHKKIPHTSRRISLDTLKNSSNTKYIWSLIKENKKRVDEHISVVNCSSHKQRKFYLSLIYTIGQKINAYDIIA